MTDILIVEDSPTQAMQLEIFLEAQGFRVAVAVNGREGLAAARRLRPRLIVSDIMMPVMDGYELCRLIKGDQALQDIPLILLTTLREPVDIIEALHVSADCYLSKPYDEKHLLAKIRALLSTPHKMETADGTVEVALAGKLFSITANRSQILTLLLSLYEDTLTKNRELSKTKETLEEKNDELKLKEEELRKAYDEMEGKVKNRTAALSKANETLRIQIMEREKVERELQKLLQDLKQSQIALIETEKVAALGTLIAGIAHELNNPMMGMVNFLEYCLKKTSPDDLRYGVLQDAEHETRRCIAIIQNLLTFSHIKKEGEEDFQQEALSMVLDRVLRLLAYRIEKEGVEVMCDIADGTPDVPMIISSIQQVFLNIISNALDALRDCRKKEINISTQFDRENVIVRIRDTGCGISPEIFARILDPFFTTKPVGQGTGLGLSICKSLLNAQGGELMVSSQPGSGATFSISLPRKERRN